MQKSAQRAGGVSFLIFLFLLSHVESAEWYVATNGNNTAGTNWLTAFTNIQTAINNASYGDKIFLAGHIFKIQPHLSWNKSEVTIEGGYAATNSTGAGTNNPVLWPTILTRSTANNRIFLAYRLTNSTLRKVTIRDGYLVAPGGTYAGERGGGILVSNAVNFKIEDCLILTNRVQGGYFSYSYGGGIYFHQSSGIISNSIIKGNQARQTHNDSVGGGHGGGIYVYGGNCQILRCMIRNNIAYTAGYGDARGGGVIFNSGTHKIQNSLIVSNEAYYKPGGGGGGIFAAANVEVINCTIVGNKNEGINRNSGTVTVTNSIVWGHSDDIFGTMGLYYCCISDGTDEGRNGCITNNPLFADSVYYHLKSQYGRYASGYFSRGYWTNDNITSPLIDACNPSRLPSLEPHPNGCIVNMGAYGNTEVASKSHPLEVTNHQPSGIGLSEATFNGELLHLGSSNVHVRFYWGTSDGGTNTALWQTNVYIGKITSTGKFSTNMTGLLNGQTYYYTAFASNSAPSFSWATPSKSFTAQLSPPEVRTDGVDNDGHPTVTLKGRVTSTGGDPPVVYLLWGPVCASNNFNAWPNKIACGIQTGSYSGYVAVASGSNYWYNTYGTNDVGEAWGTPYPFGAYKIIYVLPGGAGAKNGHRWEDAFGTLAEAIANCTSIKTNKIYLKTGYYTIPDEIVWSPSHKIILEGGYEGIGYPGNRNPEKWPSTVRNSGNQIRLFNIQNSPFAVMRGINIRGGNIPSQGGAIKIQNSNNILIDECKILLNTAGGNPGHGGGIFLTNSTATIRNCIIWGNRSLLNGKGGAIYAIKGNTLIHNCLIIQNDAPSQGDGIYIETGANASIENCTIAGNKGEGIRGPATATVKNSILWKNADDVAGTPVLQYSCIGDGDNNGVNGCFADDPLFNYGFYLLPNSPCINAGNTTAELAGLNNRTTLTNGSYDAGTVDLGWHYPAGITGIYMSALYVSPDGDDANSGTNKLEPLKTITKALNMSDVGTKINIATGLYSAATSETFPLVISKPGIHLKGTDPYNTIVLASGNKRVMTVTNASFIKIENLNITGGYNPTVNGGDPNGYAAGIFIHNVNEIWIISSIITNNLVQGGWYTYNNGGGLYGYNSSVYLTNCIVKNNRARNTYWGAVGYGRGGGVYVASGKWMMQKCVFSDNTAYGQGYSQSGGGGLYLAGGPHELKNCLIVNNTATWTYGAPVGGGIWANGTIRLWNCTIVTNKGCDGLYREGGFVSITNCIFWGNGDDLVNISSNVGYSCIEDGDFEGIKGNISTDPLFADWTYCHLKSMAGYYTDGYFSGGKWSKAKANSPLIDAGNPADNVGSEPKQNGRRINMGAYGGTSVASKTYCNASIIILR